MGPCILGFYKHYRIGEIYHVIADAKHSETGEALIVYMHVKSGEVWVRPRAMFFEIVKNDKKLSVQRFRKIAGKRVDHTPTIDDLN
jgi:hypothetical protein